MQLELAKYLIAADATLTVAIEQLNQRATQILLVVSENRRLLGTITDGDIRRAMLRHLPCTVGVAQIMQSNPLTARSDWSPQQAQSLMLAKKVHQIPVVDDVGALTGVFTEESLISQDELPNTAVLMVGGMGKRLGEMTRNCPKPMLKIGGKPILETTIESLRNAGISKFVLAVNYLADQIESHFGDGSGHGVSISYFRESEPLGTAGAIGQMELSTDCPILVMNGDILTRVNYGHLLHYHSLNEACATMCVREFNQQIPFGVVELEGNEISVIREKPTTRFFVNSGIYVLSPETLHYLPTCGAFDMPSLFTTLKEQRKATVAYPIQEYWADVGQPGDFQQAEDEYSIHFDAI